MAEKKITPMMKQYLDIKREYAGEVLFFRLGDFYEMFLDDAKEVSRLLNLTLTHRNGIMMCGIPYHAAKTYIKRLLDEGKKIAICEQVKMPEESGAIATREVVQVISPGTVVEEEFLEDHDSNYLLSVTIFEQKLSCAYCDISSSTFYTTDLEYDGKLSDLRSLIEQLRPKEIIVDETVFYENSQFSDTLNQYDIMIDKLPSWHFSLISGFEKLCEAFSTVNLKPFGLQSDSVALVAAGALIHYIESTSRQQLQNLYSLIHVTSSRTMNIDESTRRNLELICNQQDNSHQRTLFSAINQTCTSGGSRLLKEWISSPLRSIAQITSRQDKVSWFIANGEEHHRVRSLLKESRDLIRLTSRISLKRNTPQDLLAIAATLTQFFKIIRNEPEFYTQMLDREIDDEVLNNLMDLLKTLNSGVHQMCSGIYTPHKVIADSYDETLDEYRSLYRHGGDTLKEYVDALKEETSIPQIKLSHNKIIGHYLEITKTHSAKVPDYFYRKQTLVNAERYTTEHLVELEMKIRESEQRAADKERELYDQIVGMVNEERIHLHMIGAFLSTLDCLQSFAHTAVKYSYCRPQINENTDYHIVNGRHPVVEQFLEKGSFIANSLYLNDSKGRFCLITGPNMAGKSTYLRQSALIVLLAHIGSFVPADSARIGLTDALFCRVGASDNLARGESTFLIEMQETSYILRKATTRSLVIMDEIGRGTSTQDGMSIAYAVMRKMVELKTCTLFATHYHELTMLDTEGMQLLTLAVKEYRKDIIFLRKVIEGIANSSYGLHVAKMAGMPKDVLQTASYFQQNHYASYSFGSNTPQLDLFTSHPDESESNPLKDMIEAFPLENSTPMQAMLFVEELKKVLEDEA
ncbi:MAG: DNA mismatch repair protein MutS [Sphaerochaetaceae bacterium]